MVVRNSVWWLFYYSRINFNTYLETILLAVFGKDKHGHWDVLIHLAPLADDSLIYPGKHAHPQRFFFPKTLPMLSQALGVTKAYGV